MSFIVPGKLFSEAKTFSPIEHYVKLKPAVVASSSDQITDMVFGAFAIVAKGIIPRRGGEGLIGLCVQIQISILFYSALCLLGVAQHTHTHSPNAIWHAKLHPSRTAQP